jgi:hypothetical protein
LLQDENSPDTGGGTTAGPGTTTSGTTPGTTAKPANDTEAATSALLTDKQLSTSTTWTPQPVKTTPSNNDMWTAVSSIPQCTSITGDLGVVASQRSGTASQTWDKASTATAQSALDNEVELYSSVQPVQVAQVLVESPQVIDCLGTAMNQAVTNTQTTQPVTLAGKLEGTKYDVGLTSQALGVNWVQGFRFTATLASGATSANVSIRVVIYGYGRGIGTVSTMDSTTAAEPTELSQQELSATVKNGVANLKAVAA